MTELDPLGRQANRIRHLLVYLDWAPISLFPVNEPKGKLATGLDSSLEQSASLQSRSQIKVS